jgi:hypothetical protein
MNTERINVNDWRARIGIKAQRTYRGTAKPDIIIAIDPDTKDNGVAELHKDRSMIIRSMNTADLQLWIKNTADQAEQRGKKLVVVLEAGWLNHGNWHLKFTDSPKLAASKGYDVGANHQIGKIIQEWCEANQIDCHLQMPLKKCWNTHDGKISAKELQSIVGVYGIKLPKPCSQDMRDAVLLAWNYANLPIIVTPIAKKVGRKNRQTIKP